jgi:hypothetical protein
MTTSHGNGFSPAYWELVELVLAGCPDAALKAYRRTLVIGKGKRLTAKQADNAISGATKVMCKPGNWSEWESMQHWYLRQGLPCLLARRYDDYRNPHVARMLAAVSDHYVLLEWDDNGVDRSER